MFCFEKAIESIATFFRERKWRKEAPLQTPEWLPFVTFAPAMQDCERRTERFTAAAA